MLGVGKTLTISSFRFSFLLVAILLYRQVENIPRIKNDCCLFNLRDSFLLTPIPGQGTLAIAGALPSI